jgi:hypothetical protein
VFIEALVKPNFLRVGHLKMKLEAQDFLVRNAEHFPILLVINKQGQGLFRRNGERRDSSLSDAYIKSVKLDPDILYSKSFQDKPFGGHDVRLFIEPLSKAPFKGYFLVGVASKDRILSSKLTVSPKALMWMILVLLMTISITPLLKILSVNAGYVYRSSDITFAILGIVLSVSLVTIACSQHLFATYFNKHKVRLTEDVFKTIASEFKAELNQSFEMIEVNKEKLCESNNKKTVTNEIFPSSFISED